MCPLVVHSIILTATASAVDASAVFWKSEAEVNERVAFQFSLTAPSNVSLSSLPFVSLSLYFSHNPEPLVVWHCPSAPAVVRGGVLRVELGDVPAESQDNTPVPEVQANLRWEQGSKIIFTGCLASDVPTTLKVRSL